MILIEEFFCMRETNECSMHRSIRLGIRILLCYLNLYDSASPHDWVMYFDSFEHFLACRENTHNSIQSLLTTSLLGGKVDLGLLQKWLI